MKPVPLSSTQVHAPVAVRARTTFPLHDQLGQRVTCLDGKVWITQHRDERDVVLEAGQCFVLDRPGLALVFAFQDAIVTVAPHAAGEACAC